MIRVAKVNKLRGKDRDSVCYCGRAFAGWPESKWHNPYRAGERCSTNNALALFSIYLTNIGRCGVLDQYLDELWEACEHGNKPLGCWCIDAVHGDGQPITCHAQILAELLHNKYITGDNERVSVIDILDRSSII